MVVCIVKEDQLEFLTWLVGLFVLELKLMPARNALCVHVGSWSPFEAVGMSL